jgi:hypothetical protein
MGRNVSYVKKRTPPPRYHSLLTSASDKTAQESGSDRAAGGPVAGPRRKSNDALPQHTLPRDAAVRARGGDRVRRLGRRARIGVTRGNADKLRRSGQCTAARRDRGNKRGSREQSAFAIGFGGPARDSFRSPGFVSPSQNNSVQHSSIRPIPESRPIPAKQLNNRSK